MAEVKINIERCKGCELCTIVCPKEILKKGSNINSKGYQYVEVTDRDECIGCAMCAMICPDVALEVWK
jgi:2-oxoglutarate ferredoxin oxidoreductase subunit delta